MPHITARAALAALVVIPRVVGAQSFDTAGTRAAGMSGAFVAVADDASATYWNPGGLAAGSYFSLVLDRGEARTGLSEPSAGSRSGWLIALATPALGLSYYRLRSTALTPPDSATAASQLGRNVIGPGDVRLDSLVTHHLGATLVQSLFGGVAIGATLKVVRGSAMTAVVADEDRDALLADVDVRGESRSRFDADVGVLASSGAIRVGLAVRNITEPEFPTGDKGRSAKLARQARAGAAVQATAGWVVAADFELLKTAGPFGDSRDAAFGVEGRVARRGTLRGGVRFNTAGGLPEGRAPSASVGGSYAARPSVLVDGQITVGSERSARGWGIAARFVY